MFSWLKTFSLSHIYSPTLLVCLYPTSAHLPVTLVVTDKDKENTANSEFNITMVSQTPAEPKIAVQQLPGGLAKLTLKGCFDYDVRFIAIFLLNLWKVNVHANKHVEFSNISNIFICFRKQQSIPSSYKQKIVEQSQRLSPLLLLLPWTLSMRTLTNQDLSRDRYQLFYLLKVLFNRRTY